MITEYRHRVTIQQPTETLDALGEPMTTWATYAERWSSIEPTTGSESVIAYQVGATANVKMRMRYTPSITPKMRAVYGSRTFQILAVLDMDDRRAETTLMCVEEVAT